MSDASIGQNNKSKRPNMTDMTMWSQSLNMRDLACCKYKATKLHLIQYSLFIPFIQFYTRLEDIEPPGFLMLSDPSTNSQSTLSRFKENNAGGACRLFTGPNHHRTVTATGYRQRCRKRAPTGKEKSAYSPQIHTMTPRLLLFVTPHLQKSFPVICLC